MMMEKLDQAKTHLELKKMIAEVDRENRGLFQILNESVFHFFITFFCERALFTTLSC